jgi:hypothetical protein
MFPVLPVVYHTIGGLLCRSLGNQKSLISRQFNLFFPNYNINHIFNEPQNARTQKLHVLLSYLIIL